MFEKQKKILDDKIIQPVKNATALAITAISLAILALIIAVVKLCRLPSLVPLPLSSGQLA